MTGALALQFQTTAASAGEMQSKLASRRSMCPKSKPVTCAQHTMSAARQCIAGRGSHPREELAQARLCWLCAAATCLSRVGGPQASPASSLLLLQVLLPLPPAGTSSWRQCCEELHRTGEEHMLALHASVKGHAELVQHSAGK